MSINTLLPEFAPQCCDAISYPHIGIACANGGACYGDLRPGGTYYWFSLPARLGLPNEILILFNLSLLLLSALLAASVLSHVGERIIKPTTGNSLPRKLFLVALCVGVHFLFLQPVIFTTLSDPPAALFLLIGAWGLLLSCFVSGIKQPALILVASLSLGGAAWIRAFYLYPVMVCMGVCLFAVACSPGRKWHHALVVFALAFPGIQFYNTYSTTGHWAYFGGNEANRWTNTHLNSPLIGYDTIFPNGSYMWRPRACTAPTGIIASLQARDYSSFACMLANRGAFYAATYVPTNYIYPDIKNRLFGDAIEDIGNDNFWLRQNLDWQPNTAQDPLGNTTADKLIPQPYDSEDGAYVTQWVSLPADIDYTFSTWLWAEKPATIALAMTRHVDNQLIACMPFSVSQQPQRFSITGRTISNGEYNVTIGAPPAPCNGNQVSGSPQLTTPFYTWGAQLEAGTLMTEYAGVESAEGDSVRVWHPWLLLANGLALLTAMLLIIRVRTVFLFEPTGIAVTALIAAIFAEALLIIPEQRFAITFMVCVWLLASAYIFFWLVRRSQGSPSSLK